LLIHIFKLISALCFLLKLVYVDLWQKLYNLHLSRKRSSSLTSSSGLFKEAKLKHCNRAMEEASLDDHDGTFWPGENIF